ncbi:MAG TPA: hypothetical protein VLA85_04235 [Verrucomicrobiae bacterium]|jgi:hypothetical protein|nr:hypothetical protein [Verrucomicrobiae bacterium]
MSVETGMSAPTPRPLWRRILRRGPWENLATVLIGAGVVMLMQPVSIDLYGYSLVTMLTGTVMFIIVTKFPD